jgi:hypothetical protein
VGGNGRRWTRLAAIAAFIAAFAGLSALAAGQLSSQSKSVKLKPGENGTLTPRCRGGSEAVSGGFAAPGFKPGGKGPAILPFTSRRTPSEKAWEVRGHNFDQKGPGGKGELIAYAYCDKHKPPVIERTKAKEISPSSVGDTIARCPGGSEAVSGGFVGPNAKSEGASIFAYVSRRIGDRKWKVAALNNDTTDPHKLKVFVYCNKHEPGLTSKTNKENVDPLKTVSLVARCSNGRQAVSGGYKSTLDINLPSATLAFGYTSHRVSGTGWKVAAVGNGSGDHAATESAIAYCQA